MSNTPLIKYLCSNLPGNITRPMYQDYEKRWAEINTILKQEGNNYQVLREYETTVQSLLAASLFYRFVLAHMKGAAGFYNAINKNREKECVVKIGDSVLDKKQYNKLLGATIAFEKIRNIFQIQICILTF